VAGEREWSVGVEDGVRGDQRGDSGMDCIIMNAHTSALSRVSLRAFFKADPTPAPGGAPQPGAGSQQAAFFQPPPPIELPKNISSPHTGGGKKFGKMKVKKQPAKWFSKFHKSHFDARRLS